MKKEQFIEKNTPQYSSFSEDIKEGFNVFMIGFIFLILFVFIMGFLIGSDPEDIC